jgi:hypothetical protein
MAGSLVGALEAVLTGGKFPAAEERVECFTRCRLLGGKLLASVRPAVAGSILESVARDPRTLNRSEILWSAAARSAGPICLTGALMPSPAPVPAGGSVTGSYAF